MFYVKGCISDTSGKHLFCVQTSYFLCSEFSVHFLRNKAGPSVLTDVPGEQGCGFGVIPVCRLCVH